MLPVAGKPFLENIVLRALQAGVYDFVLVVGYHADLIRSHFGDGSRFGVSIDYATQEEQMGTGHALHSAYDLADDQFLVLNGDVLPDEESLRRMTEYEETPGKLYLAARRVLDPSRYGALLVDDGILKLIVEKSPSPPSDLINAGIYRLDLEIFDALLSSVSDRSEYELTDGLNKLVSRGRKIEVIELNEWIEIGMPSDILNANEAILPSLPYSIQGVVEPNATLSGMVTVGRSYISGPVMIGKGCEIGPNCFIRPCSCIGNNVRIGHGVEVKNSSIMENTNIGHLSYVGDSVVGSGCNFGAGTIVANLRHDDKNVQSYVNGKKIDSCRRKLGVIMGDDVKTGINTTIYPGTVIESGYRGRPGEVLWGYVTSSL
jgi:bifunctional UDP-N-acetylglucosamine pyrophosphorylase/glucosamine-1-phosphate N-acetyltransferase